MTNWFDSTSLKNTSWPVSGHLIQRFSGDSRRLRKLRIFGRTTLEIQFMRGVLGAGSRSLYRLRREKGPTGWGWSVRWVSISASETRAALILRRARSAALRAPPQDEVECDAVTLTRP